MMYIEAKTTRTNENKVEEKKEAREKQVYKVDTKCGGNRG